MKQKQPYRRVVVTGLGVISPNAIGKTGFLDALREGKSGIRHIPWLEKSGFRCQLAGVPAVTASEIAKFRHTHSMEDLESTGILYGLMAGQEAWKDAKLDSGNRNRDRSCIFGSGSNGIEATEIGIHLMDEHRIADGAQSLLPQMFNNGVSLYLSRMLGLGGQVMNNASACSTGTEAVLMGYDKIKDGQAAVVLVGSSESSGKYVWGPFDSMFATAQGFNEVPEKASCPLSRNANGFVPAAGSGALVLESLESATARGASIYAEVLGGHINSGGHRGNGSMTLGNLNGMVRCIRQTLKETGCTSNDIDLVSGHLTSTMGDVYEMRAWVKALGRQGLDFPYINTPKSMIGHALSASGAIEAVAVVLQLHHGFIHPSLNAFPLHPDIAGLVDASRIPTASVDAPSLKVAAKVNLGFGDVNSCVIFRKWEEV